MKPRNEMQKDSSAFFNCYYYFSNFIFNILFAFFWLLLFRFLFVYAFVLEAVKLESAEKSERSYAGVILGTEGIYVTYLPRAQPDVDESNLLFSLICIRFGTFKVRRLKRA